MERNAASRMPSFETPVCPICDAALDPDLPTCRDCAYGGLDPETYVRLFWEEA